MNAILALAFSLAAQSAQSLDQCEVARLHVAHTPITKIELLTPGGSKLEVIDGQRIELYRTFFTDTGPYIRGMYSGTANPHFQVIFHFDNGKKLEGSYFRAPSKISIAHCVETLSTEKAEIIETLISKSIKEQGI